MLAEHRLTSWGDEEWCMGFDFSYILHRVMNESKHCECKKVIKSCKYGCQEVF
jgi:hypothetical protein